jgi:hypothetical protein
MDLVDKEENINGQITEDYCKTLEKIELAILAKKNVHASYLAMHR